MTDSDAAPELARRLGTTTLTLYGVGVIVGAGIYVLIGEVAAGAGTGVWLAFLLASLAALPTGLSYASLASRHPRSAGEAVYVERATGQPWLAFVVGYLVLTSGVCSTAAVGHGFARYLAALWPASEPFGAVVIVAFLAALSFISFRGMTESVWVNGICTVASVLALAVLVAAGAPVVLERGVPELLAPDGSALGASALIGATALGFYAFIGFEDICNVAEEVRSPERTIPRAILAALGIVTLIYLAVGLVVVTAVPPAELARSSAPLALVAERLLPGLPAGWLSAVALFAVTNTALFNLIMGSRIIYGMARQGWVPAALGAVHPRRRTPSRAIVIVFFLAALAALTGFLRVLAEATNVILLSVFVAVNVSLLVIRWRGVPKDDPNVASFEVPWVVPLVGAVLTSYLVTRFSAGAYLRAGLLAATGGVLFALGRGARRQPC